MNYNELSKRIHQNAVDHGFWEENLSDEHCLALVISEVGEMIEAYRKDKRADVEAFENAYPEKIQQYFEMEFKKFIKDTVEDEMADIVIRLLDLAGARGVNVVFYKTPTRWFSGESFTQHSYFFVRRLIMSEWNDGIEACINDAISFIGTWVKKLEIDLEWHIEQKMKYNQTRPYKHGKNC